FTNIKNKSDIDKLKKFGKVFRESVKNLNLKNYIVLDPESNKTLAPEDKKFDYFIFGGILGDYPPKKRTKKELTKFLPKAETRNIGKKQMATDNAVYVVNEILKGKNFDKLKFQDKVELKFNEFESVELPFRYILDKNNKPLISKKVIDYLKKKKGF
ncbi:MAG: SAM-dependent methyltransferase, partial [Nanoarchaeota archaeon]|nr:SAM-dependent methyltransferase [Nanoarchaeota archaeon]